MPVGLHTSFITVSGGKTKRCVTFISHCHTINLSRNEDRRSQYGVPIQQITFNRAGLDVITNTGFCQVWLEIKSDLTNNWNRTKCIKHLFSHYFNVYTLNEPLLNTIKMSLWVNGLWCQYFKSSNPFKVVLTALS